MRRFCESVDRNHKKGVILKHSEFRNRTQLNEQAQNRLTNLGEVSAGDNGGRLVVDHLLYLVLLILLVKFPRQQECSVFGEQDGVNSRIRLRGFGFESGSCVSASALRLFRV